MEPTELVECEWNGRRFLGAINSYGIVVVQSPITQPSDLASEQSTQ